MVNYVLHGMYNVQCAWHDLHSSHVAVHAGVHLHVVAWKLRSVMYT